MNTVRRRRQERKSTDAHLVSAPFTSCLVAPRSAIGPSNYLSEQLDVHLFRFVYLSAWMRPKWCVATIWIRKPNLIHFFIHCGRLGHSNDANRPTVSRGLFQCHTVSHRKRQSFGASYTTGRQLLHLWNVQVGPINNCVRLSLYMSVMIVIRFSPKLAVRDWWPGSDS